MNLFVVQRNTYIGILSEDNDPHSFKFIYTDNINSNDYITGLDLKENKSNTLFPIFENLILEREEQITAIRIKYEMKYQIEIFLHSTNVQGSFEFYKTENETLKSTSQNIFQYAQVKHEILGDYTYPAILNDYKLINLLENNFNNINNVIGLSGYQDKYAIIKNDENHTILYANDQETEYFIKPFNLDFTHYHKGKEKFEEYRRKYHPFLLINEHIFMSLAKKFGFDVPYNALIKDSKYDEYHLIIKRYDRYQKKYKFDHETINVILGKPSIDKYNCTMKEIINSIKLKINHDEMVILFKFIIFSIIISHGDLHAKNLSLIYCSNRFGDKTMVFAPVYDVLTTNIYTQYKEDIAIKINNKKSNIKTIDLLVISKQMEIDEELAKSIIYELCNKFLNLFLDHIKKLPESILMLLIKTSNHHHHTTLITKYTKFFNNRKKYIERCLIESTTKKNIF